MSWRAPPFDPDVEIRDHQDSDGWAAALASVLVKHPELGKTGKWFESGSDVVWGTEAYVIKLTSPHWRTQSRRESKLLHGLPSSLPFTVPEVVLEDEIDGWPYFVMTRVAGIPIGDAWRKASDDERLKLAFDLGEATATLHRAGPIVPGEGIDEWNAFFSPFLDAIGQRHRKRFGDQPFPTWANSIDAFVQTHLGAAPERGLLHTEILDQHVLVDADGSAPAICGMIDFADARYGAIDYDFAAPVEFIFKGAPGALDAFCRGYGFDGDALAQALDPNRRLAWALAHQFGSLSRMLGDCPGPPPTSLEALGRALYAR